MRRGGQRREGLKSGFADAGRKPDIGRPLFADIRCAISLPSFSTPMRICSGGTVTKLRRKVLDAGVFA